MLSGLRDDIGPLNWQRTGEGEAGGATGVIVRY